MSPLFVTAESRERDAPADRAARRWAEPLREIALQVRLHHQDPAGRQTVEHALDVLLREKALSLALIAEQGLDDYCEAFLRGAQRQLDRRYGNDEHADPEGGAS